MPLRRAVAAALFMPSRPIRSPEPPAIVSLANRHFPPIHIPCKFAPMTARRATVQRKGSGHEHPSTASP
jgi:hypothetical protein